jgi:hypothetical protein
MKEQGKLWHLSAKRMSNAHPAGNLLYTDFGICACLFQTRLASRTGLADRSAPGSGETHSDFCAARDGIE